MVLEIFYRNGNKIDSVKETIFPNDRLRLKMWLKLFKKLNYVVIRWKIGVRG